MNRIEQVATPTPAQQPQPRRPRSLADARRRAAHVLFQPRFHPRESSARTRRGTTGLAVAIAALAVPMLPSAAFGAASAGPGAVGTGNGTSTSTGSGARVGVGAARAAAPHTRHHLSHLHHGQVVPDPDTVSVEEWAASGWTLTLPSSPSSPVGEPDAGLMSHLLMHHHGYYVPWLVEPARAVHASGPGVRPDGSRPPGIEAFRVSHSSPRADDPDAPESQAPADTTYAFSDLPTAGRAVRSRPVPNPLIPTVRPTAMQMPVAARPASGSATTTTATAATTANLVSGPPVPRQAAADPAASPCMRAAYMVGKDRHMLAHLRPAMDAMNVVVTHRRTACTAMVDYLSQARA